MNYTLKIHWSRYAYSPEGVGGIADETTLFIPADEVRVHGEIVDREREMKHWVEGLDGGYMNYLSVIESRGIMKDAEITETTESAGRLIEVIHGDGEHCTRWYLASKAWVLGPTGDTIERVAP